MPLKNEWGKGGGAGGGASSEEDPAGVCEGPALPFQPVGGGGPRGQRTSLPGARHMVRLPEHVRGEPCPLFPCGCLLAAKVQAIKE